MIVSSLALKNFRSYESLELTFGEKANLVVGDNGTGKTNLVEAIYYLSLAKSWRTQDVRALIKEGTDEASITARIQEGGMVREIRIVISKEGRRIAVNGSPVRRLSDLSKLVNVTLFSPEDALLFKGTPGDRRNFLDVSLSKKSLDYLSLIGRHEKLLTNRNAALKAEHPDLDYIAVLTDAMIACGESIERYRRLYIDELNKTLSGLASRLYGEKRTAVIELKSFVKGDDYAQEAKKAYERSLESDLLRKSTGVGIQREDFSLLLDGHDISLYGSQGENRLAAIALKIAPYFLIDEENKKPIAVLDDVYSELDVIHKKNLQNILSEMGQSFITATNEDDQPATIIAVKEHTAIRRN